MFGWTRGRGREDKMVEDWKKKRERDEEMMYIFFFCMFGKSLS